MFTRKQVFARMARLKAQRADARFFTSTPCKKGHILRYTSTGNCVMCCKARAAARYYLFKSLALS